MFAKDNKIMTIDKKEVVTIPKWIIMILAPIIFGSLAGWGVGRYTSGKNEKTLEITVKDVDLLKATKVSKDEFLIIKDQLNRIEVKLDDHIAK